MPTFDQAQTSAHFSNTQHTMIVRFWAGCWARRPL